MGSALGFGGVWQNLGTSITPPLGNALSALGLHTPFLLWAGSGVFATVVLLSYRRKRR